MSKLRNSPDIESLTTMPVGQDFEIVRVLLRESGRGGTNPYLRRGRRWRCSYSGSASMLLVSITGQAISVPLDVARFVQVQRM